MVYNQANEMHSSAGHACFVEYDKTGGISRHVVMSINQWDVGKVVGCKGMSWDTHTL